MCRLHGGKAGLRVRHLWARGQPLRNEMRPLCALRARHRPSCRCDRAGPPRATTGLRGAHGRQAATQCSLLVPPLERTCDLAGDGNRRDRDLARRVRPSPSRQGRGLCPRAPRNSRCPLAFQLPPRAGHPVAQEAPPAPAEGPSRDHRPLCQVANSPQAPQPRPPRSAHTEQHRERPGRDHHSSQAPRLAFGTQQDPCNGWPGRPRALSRLYGLSI